MVTVYTLPYPTKSSWFPDICREAAVNKDRNGERLEKVSSHCLCVGTIVSAICLHWKAPWNTVSGIKQQTCCYIPLFWWSGILTENTEMTYVCSVLSGPSVMMTPKAVRWLRRYGWNSRDKRMHCQYGFFNHMSGSWPGLGEGKLSQNCQPQRLHVASLAWQSWGN